MTNWFHTNCLFEQMKNPRAVKLESSEDLEGFDEIQAEDKELIQKLIEKRGKRRTEFKMQFNTVFCIFPGDEPDSPKPGSSQKKRKSKNEASDSSGESSSKKSKKSKKSSSKSGEKGKSSKVDKKEEEKKKKRKKKSEKESESEDE